MKWVRTTHVHDIVCDFCHGIITAGGYYCYQTGTALCYCVNCFVNIHGTEPITVDFTYCHTCGEPVFDKDLSKWDGSGDPYYICDGCLRIQKKQEENALRKIKELANG